MNESVSDSLVLQMLENLTVSVRVHKFGTTTLIKDTAFGRHVFGTDVDAGKFGDLPKAMWRVKIGKGSDWAYGETMIAAVRSAFANSEATQ